MDRYTALVDELREQHAETSIIEFKKDNANPNLIGKLCAALSNVARIEQQDFAYILWGIDDESHEVVGTNFDFDSKKVGNQVFEFWLAQQLNPSIAFSFKVIEHSDGRIVLLEVPAATVSPVEFNGTAYVRIGSATPKLSDHPERFQKLINNLRPFTWEKGIAKAYVEASDVLALLDYPSYFKHTQQPLPENREGILEKLEAANLLNSDVGGRWNITNLGAMLLAVDLDEFEQSVSRKAVRFIAYDGSNRASQVTHRQDGKKGYVSGFGGLVAYINNLLPSNEYIGEVFRQERRIYPEIAIRELIANALIHQDMTISGTGPVVELFSDRMEITNPGKPLIKTERMIDMPPRSRNDALARLMRQMKFCEELGTGMDKVVINCELFQLPAPNIQAFDDSTRVTLYAPRSFAKMTAEERVRACYQHAVIKILDGDRMRNATLCERFAIDASSNAAQATKVINLALAQNMIKPAEEGRPRTGYVPYWA